MRRVAIIGGGIAGLCAATYAQKSGYDVLLFEQSATVGGLATSWQRGDYTFETCLYWLLGSRPQGWLHDQWREVCDIDALTFVNPKEYARIEDQSGASLSIPADVDRFEAELVQHAPDDAAEIRRLAASVRRLSSLAIPMPGESLPHTLVELVSALPALPDLHFWSGVTMREYAEKFHDPLLQRFIGGGESGDLSALAFVFSLAWMHSGNAGYPIGGSQALIRAILDAFRGAGGDLRTNASVQRVVVENDVATGVQLRGGETVNADWVISAADGFETVYELLGGRYVDQSIAEMYQTWEPFPSYVQVSLGIARDLSKEPGYVILGLETPLDVDPATGARQAAFRIFNFDRTFAPEGKTAVTCFLPTHNYIYWTNLHQREPKRYAAEKERIAHAVIELFERRIPGIRDAVEVVDVSTPATVIRCTRNWRGSMEGWVLNAQSGYRPLRNTLPGVEHFNMVGQWIAPGGGLPSGLLTARHTIQELCKHDRMEFLSPR